MKAIFVLLFFGLPEEKEVLNLELRNLFRRSILNQEIDSWHELLILESTKEEAILYSRFQELIRDNKGEVKGLVIPNRDFSLYMPLLERVPSASLTSLFSLGEKNPEIYDSLLPLIAKEAPGILHTIKVYIETGRSPLISSYPLYVHRNTVTYRVKAFEKRTGISLDQFENVMFVYALINRFNLSTEEKKAQ